MILAPTICPEAPKWISMNLPCRARSESVCRGVPVVPGPRFIREAVRTKRELLSFRTVLALPKASSTGLQHRNTIR
jgi:hypothetical protein